MEEFLYTCDYCSGQFEPKRRGHQKYCSNSCRSKAYRKRKQEEIILEPHLPTTQNNDVVESVPAEIYAPAKQKVEEMSAAGVGNAALGALIAGGAIALVNKLAQGESEPATKREVNELKSLIKGYRYFPIKNMEQDQYGRHPYFDIEKWELVYFATQQ